MRRPRRIGACAAAVLLCAAVWAALAPMLADRLVVVRPLAAADAIVILSGAADYKQRAAGGAIAYEQGLASLVLLTDDGQRGGWDDTTKGNPYFVERTKQLLQSRGVPGEAIEVVGGKVASTRDEAEEVIDMAVSRGFSRILLVTSPYHSRRALMTFERAAGDRNAAVQIGIVPSPADAGYPDRTTWWLSIRGWRSVGGEYMKSALYWLFNLI